MELQLKGRYPVVQQDNASPHTSKVFRDALDDCGLVWLRMPPHSPDLNPIEHVWAWIKNKLRSMHWIRTNAQLIEQVKRLWAEIPMEVLTNIIESMPSRVKAVIDRQGWPTKY